MNKKNKFINVSSILTLLICLFAAVVIWIFAKYNNFLGSESTAAIIDFVNTVI